MDHIVRILIGASLLLLLGGTMNAADAFPAGRFISAADLTRGESTAVQRLTKSTGKKPWLIWGFRFGTNPKPGVDRTELGVYLEPDVENGRLRRGRVMTIVFAPAKAGARSSWRVESVSKYAQVAVPGRPPGDLESRWDIARPFSLATELDDQALVSLVDFIRASPDQVDGSMAVTWVRRTAKGLEVHLQRKDWQGNYVTVEQRKDRWVVLDYRFWIA